MTMSEEHDNTHTAAHRHDPHAHHRMSGWTKLFLAGAAMSAGIILAPHLLPMVGVGDLEIAKDALQSLHPFDTGAGLAGFLGSLPVVGSVASSGFMGAVATGVVGIGGVLLGNYVEKNEDGSSRIKWGNVIKTAAIATSILFALPTVLTGVSMGLIYLGQVAVESGMLEAATASGLFGVVANTIGTIGGAVHSGMMGTSGLLATLPHLLTCGVSLVPATISWAISGDPEEPAVTASNERYKASIMPSSEGPALGEFTAKLATKAPTPQSFVRAI